MWPPAVKRVPFLLGRFLYRTVREELRSPVTAGQDLGNFEVRRVTAYLEMMGKALLPRASESVLHAEQRRLLWGAKPFKAIGNSSSVSCSPVIPSRYRNPSVQDARYLFVANRSPQILDLCYAKPDPFQVATSVYY